MSGRGDRGAGRRRSGEGRRRLRDWLREEGFPALGRVFQFRSVRPDPVAEVDAEIDYHLERTEAELVREGLPPERARREAERRFGDREAHRQRLLRINRRRGRKERMRGAFESVRDVLVHALRSLSSTPGLSLTVVVTLALGIGANATVFGIVDRLLLRAPGHVAEPESVVRLYVDRAFLGNRRVTAGVTYPDVRDWQAADGFASVAALTSVWGNGTMTMGHGEDAEKLMGQQVSASFFSLLGVEPHLGRFFRQEDDRGAAAVAVLGHDFWRRRFGGDPDVVGERIALGGIPHRVVGVAPEGFTGVDLQRIDLWTPLRSGAMGMNPAYWGDSRGYYWLRAVARLAPGTSPAEASAEATALHRAGRAEDNRYDPSARVLAGSLIAARGPRPSDESRVARWLAGVSLLVLLIACANVANLLLARGIRMRSEVGVRLALGISGRRLLGQLLTQTVLLALLGGVAALALAYWGGDAARLVLLPDVHWVESPLSTRVLGFTFCVALLTGLGAGLLPALHAMRQDVVSILAAGRRSGDGSRSRARTALALVQTSLSVVLLVGAGLFVRSLDGIRSVDLGFEQEGLLVSMPELDDEGLPRGEPRDRFFERAVRRLRRIPAVQGVTLASSVPFYSSWTTSLTVPDVPEPPQFPTGGPYVIGVDEHYFSTMGIRILEGRGFSAAELGQDFPPVAVLEESMAKAYWPDESALGKCLKLGDETAPCTKIVGIAEDTAGQTLRPDVRAHFYIPFDRRDSDPSAIFAVVAPDRVEELAGIVRRQIELTDPGVRFANVRRLSDLSDPQTRSWRLGATMFTAFGVLALLIAAVGLYGTMAFDVAQRTHEIGVRSALGAGARSLVEMVLSRALRLVAASLLLGLAVAGIGGRWIESLLYGVSALDPLVIIAVVGVLLTVAAVASLVPALRATRVDPVEALRAE